MTIYQHTHANQNNHHDDDEYPSSVTSPFSQHSDNDDADSVNAQSKRRRKISRNFTAQEFIELMHLSQRDAAKKLNVCLSTFKRQFSAVRPKLQWPTPSQRKILIHRRRFQNIIELNQEEVFPSSQFEFGKDNDHIYEEILPDPKVLSEECAQLKRMVASLQRENRDLKEQLFRASVSPPASPNHSVESSKSQESQQSVTAPPTSQGGMSDFYASALESSFFDFPQQQQPAQFYSAGAQQGARNNATSSHQKRFLSTDLMEPSFQLFAF